MEKILLPPSNFNIIQLTQKKIAKKPEPVIIQIYKKKEAEENTTPRVKVTRVKVIDKTADVIVNRRRLLTGFSSVINIVNDAPGRDIAPPTTTTARKEPPTNQPFQPFVSTEENIPSISIISTPQHEDNTPTDIPNKVLIRVSKKKSAKRISKPEVEPEAEVELETEPEVELETEPEVELEPEAEVKPGRLPPRGEKKSKRTKKIKKNIISEGVEGGIILDDKLISVRLPKKELIKIKTSKYYLNNRKKYIENISKLFQHYQAELNDSKNDISCDNSGKTETTELFIHQRIVREYLNVITPYRGLLLFHGLGSGKTCSSIAIAEGMKTNKQVVLMTPAALKTNFFSELKKCGDPLYKKNQYWEFISIEGKPENTDILASALQLESGDIIKNRGAWMVDVRNKNTNYDKLSAEDQRSIDLQLDKMIRSKYWDINYDGLTKRKMDEITKNKTVNPFDNKTVIIDEAHKFVSRVVNKIKEPKSTSYILYDYLMSASNAKIILLTGTPIVNYPNEIGILFNILRGYIRTWTFQLSLGANAPSGESITIDKIGKLFYKGGLNTFDYLDYTNNRLVITRNPFGFVNTEKITATAAAAAKPPTKGGKKTIKKKHNKTSTPHKKTKKTKKILPVIPETDPPEKNNENDEYNNYYPNYHEGGGGGKYSFQNIIGGCGCNGGEPTDLDEEQAQVGGIKSTDQVGGIKSTDQVGGIKSTDQVGGENYINNNYQGVELNENGNITDTEFANQVRQILRNNHIEIIEHGTKVVNNKALPDDSDTFFELFIDAENNDIKNETPFKKRILGLTSYFRSANEELLPRFISAPPIPPSTTSKNYFIVPCFMSPFHFSYYGKIRKAEADKERNAKKNAAKNKGKDVADMYQITSSYRSFSRAACNFAFPEEITRPLPDKPGDKDDDDEIDLTEDDTDSSSSTEEEENGEEENKPKNETPAEITYRERVINALRELKETDYLKQENLQTYSSKFYHILENIKNPEHQGLHLLYSIFRTLEGIGILKLVFEANGMTEFKIRKNGREWEIDNGGEPITSSSFSSPRFVLYTGTENAEEKEVIRNIYNSNWEVVPSSITEQLRKIAPNNYMGEIIKIFMITASGTEGINLKNTRYVHIVEPYWNMSRIEQTIGRARRICSHQNLPEELRTVQVFFYINTFTEEQIKAGDNREMMVRDVSRINGRPITTDENLYEIADIKTSINNKILRSVKETAMDCSVYSGVSGKTAQKEGDEQLVCYNVGKVQTNSFLSFPSFQEEILLGETDNINIRKEKVKLVKITYEGEDYAVDKTNLLLYSYKSYELAKSGKGVLQQVGHLEKHGKKYIPVFDIR